MLNQIFKYTWMICNFFVGIFILYGTKCVGRIVTKSMSYFLHLCDCSLPYCATLEAWTGLKLDNTSMQATPGHQLAKSKCHFIFRQLFFEKF